MDAALGPAVAGLLGPLVAFGLVVPWLVRRYRARICEVLSLLAERGPLTLDELAVATRAGTVGRAT